MGDGFSRGPLPWMGQGNRQPSYDTNAEPAEHDCMEMEEKYASLRQDYETALKALRSIPCGYEPDFSPCAAAQRKKTEWCVRCLGVSGLDVGAREG